MVRPFLASVVVLVFVASSIAVIQQQLHQSPASPSSRTSLRVTRRLQQENEQVLDAEALVLKELTNSLCGEDAEGASKHPPLVYDKCDPNGVLNVIPLMGGLTNALKFVLLGSIMSYEEGRCFYVDEEKADLNPVRNGTREGFIQKYMEPIGLPKDHPYVIKAFAEGRVQVRSWPDYWLDEGTRRVYGKKYDIPMLGYADIEGHQLKRAFIRRMWRPLPQYREATCNSLKKHDLGDEFIAFSVRRGDKSLEKFAYTSLSKYIDSAQNQMSLRFSGKAAPKIFVATDDCTVMPSFREMRPSWHFLSECDKDEQQTQEDTAGFALADVKNWGDNEQDAHFRKFFVEMYAMATSKILIGITYTNVSWWVFFLRPFRHSFILLDKKEGTSDLDILSKW